MCPRLRMLLNDLLYFGPGPLEQQLDTAYKSFLAFCRQHKTKHSQPPFTLRCDSWWQTLALFHCFKGHGTSEIPIPKHNLTYEVIYSWLAVAGQYSNMFCMNLIENPTAGYHLGGKEKDRWNRIDCEGLERTVYPQLALSLPSRCPGVTWRNWTFGADCFSDDPFMNLLALIARVSTDLLYIICAIMCPKKFTTTGVGTRTGLSIPIHVVDMLITG